VFTAFTQGYKPETHLDELFAAICTCNGFDPEALKQLAEGSTSAVSGHTVSEVREWLSKRGAGAPEPLASGISSVGGESFHYSRLMAVGLLSLLSSAQGGEPSDPVELKSLAHEIGEHLGLSKPRLDKDLSLYTSNLEKMAQAVELIEETLAAERRKRDRQVADSKSGETKNEDAQSESSVDSAAEESTN
jgi:photosystem II biogenesis protein Psp29